MALVCPRCSFPNVAHARFCAECGAALEREGSAPPDPLIGAMVANRYHLRKVLGEGGMGRVYLAEQRMGHSLRSVAVKVLTTSMNDTMAVARFYRECETVIQLSHPNTIRFYDFGSLDVPRADGSLDQRLYIAMEFIDGRSLADAIAQGPMPLDVTLHLVSQIGGALTEAHRRGIVHRDLKPDNVLLARNEVEGEIVKVCDFGIAKTAGGGTEITVQGTIIGTPAYMSPEQITGNTVDARSDVYSLALMTYEMLTGARPFEARTPLEWATAHLTLEPRSFDDFPVTRSLPEATRVAIKHALEKTADARTSSVKQFLEELRPEDIRSSSPSATPPAAPSEPELETLPRTRGALRTALSLIIGMGLLAIPAVLGLLTWLFPKGDAEPDSGLDAGVSTDPSDAGQAAYLQILQYEDRTEDATAALGAPDGRCAKIGNRGTITLELTPGAQMVTDHGPAPDLRVVLLSETTAPYRVDVGVERHQYTTVAEGLVQSVPLDVDQYGIRSFRYVRIKNREGAATVCVDAVSALHGNAR